GHAAPHILELAGVHVPFEVKRALTRSERQRRDIEGVAHAWAVFLAAYLRKGEPTALVAAAPAPRPRAARRTTCSWATVLIRLADTARLPPSRRSRFPGGCAAPFRAARGSGRPGLRRRLASRAPSLRC